MGHTFISPSRLSALTLCPGRAWAEEEARQAGHTETRNKDAETGTRKHALLAWKWRHPTAPWPTEVSDEEATYKVLSSDVDDVNLLWEGYYKNHPYRKDTMTGRVWVEQKVDVGKPLGYKEGEITGTVDNGFVYENVFEVADHKFGRRIVPADNLQNMAYAIGLGAHVDWAGRHRKVSMPGGIVRLTISQPANFQSPITSKDFDSGIMLAEWKPRLVSVIDAAKRKGAPRVPSEDACRYCLAGATQRCPERRKFIADAFNGAFEQPNKPAFMPATEEPATLAPVASVDVIQDIAETKLTQDVGTLDNATLGRLCDQANLVRGFFEQAEKELSHRLAKGKGEGSGYKLVEGRGSWAWTVEDATVEKVLRICGLKVAEIYEKKIPSVSSAKARVKIKGPKQLEKLEAICKRNPGKPTLAPEADARKAVGEAVEFKPVTPARPAWLD